MKAVADRVRAVLALLGPVGAGSRVLLLRLIGRFGWKTVGAGALVCLFAAVRYRTWIAWMLTAWAVAAWMHAPDEETETEDADEPGEQSAIGTGGEAIRGLLLELIGDGHGVHLSTVLAHLQEHGQWEGRTVAELRQHLEALGIPVQLKLKIKGTPTRGVLKTDLEALPPIKETEVSPAPSPPV
jgi:hypothetical protein